MKTHARPRKPRHPLGIDLVATVTRLTRWDKLNRRIRFKKFNEKHAEKTLAKRLHLVKQAMADADEMIPRIRQLGPLDKATPC